MNKCFSPFIGADKAHLKVMNPTCSLMWRPISVEWDCDGKSTHSKEMLCQKWVSLDGSKSEWREILRSENGE